MRKITQIVKTFEKLSPEEKAIVIKNYQDINTDYDWYKPIIDDYTAKLEKLGYYEIKMYFNGFYSQGDGACFIAGVDIDEWIKAHKKIKEFKRIYNKYTADGFLPIAIKITHTSRYYYATSTNVELEHEDQYNKEGELLEKLISDEREKIGNELYKELEKSNNYLSSEEAIAETLIANDYEFLGGKIF